MGAGTGQPLNIDGSAFRVGLDIRNTNSSSSLGAKLLNIYGQFPNGGTSRDNMMALFSNNNSNFGYQTMIGGNGTFASSYSAHPAGNGFSFNFFVKDNGRGSVNSMIIGWSQSRRDSKGIWGWNRMQGSSGSRTLDSNQIYTQRNHLYATSVSDNFSLFNFKRESIANHASANVTSQGSVIHAENVATQTAGTLTDSVSVLKLTQDNDSTGGHILMNSYSGTPTTDGTFYFDGSDLKARIGGTTYTFTKT